MLRIGSTPDFGPTQYYLLYKHFAKHFSHDTVIVGLLPFNDFRDDDIELGKRVFPDRYRPYWIGEHPNYRLVYYPAKLDEAQVRGEDPKVTLKTVLREFTHLYGALTLVKRSAVSEQPAKYSGYYDFTERELLRLQHSLRLLREEAAGRRVILLLLPALPDLQRYGRAGARPTPLAERLQAFSAAHDMEIVDLLPLLYEREREHEALFLPCDGHWNERGHAAAHAALLNRLQSGAREAQAEAPAAPDAGVKP